MAVVFWIKPWWVRWLVMSAVCAVIVVVWVFTLPHGTDRWSWAWGPPIALAGALLLAGALVALQQPGVRPYQQAVAPLGTQADRDAAVRAVRYGGVPADTAIRAAALRFGGVWENSRKRAQRSAFTRTAPIWTPIAFLAAAILNAISGSTRSAILFTALTVWTALSAVLNRRLAARMAANLTALRSAEPPLDVETPPLQPRRTRSVLAALLLFALLGASTAYWMARPLPGCKTADALVTFVHDDGTANRIPGFPSSPAPDSYRRWADRIVGYPDQVPADAKVAPHLRRIAELARGAAASAGIASIAPQVSDGPTAAQAAFRQHVQGIVDEEYALIAICHAK